MYTDGYEDYFLLVRHPIQKRRQSWMTYNISVFRHKKSHKRLSKAICGIKLDYGGPQVAVINIFRTALRNCRLALLQLSRSPAGSVGHRYGALFCGCGRCAAPGAFFWSDFFILTEGCFEFILKNIYNCVLVWSGSLLFGPKTNRYRGHTRRLHIESSDIRRNDAAAQAAGFFAHFADQFS